MFNTIWKAHRSRATQQFQLDYCVFILNRSTTNSLGFLDSVFVNPDASRNHTRQVVKRCVHFNESIFHLYILNAPGSLDQFCPKTVHNHKLFFQGTDNFNCGPCTVYIKRSTIFSVRFIVVGSHWRKYARNCLTDGNVVRNRSTTIALAVLITLSYFLVRYFHNKYNEGIYVVVESNFTTVFL